MRSFFSTLRVHIIIERQILRVFSFRNLSDHFHATEKALSFLTNLVSSSHQFPYESRRLLDQQRNARSSSSNIVRTVLHEDIFWIFALVIINYATGTLKAFQTSYYGGLITSYSNLYLELTQSP